MDLGNLFQDIEKAFRIRRDVDFDDAGIHITLETPSSSDESKVLEAVKEFEGAAYIDNLKVHTLAIAIRKINEYSFEAKEVDIPAEDGGTVKQSRYLYLRGQVAKWPVALRDFLFTIFNNMQAELEDKIKENTKFEMYSQPVEAPPSTEEQLPGDLKKVDVPDEPLDMTDVEKESVEAMKNVEREQAKMDQASTDG